MTDHDNVFLHVVVTNAQNDKVIARAAELRAVLAKNEPDLNNGEICSALGLFVVEALMMIAKASSKFAMGTTDSIQLTAMDAALTIAKEATDAIHQITHDMLLNDPALQPQQEGEAK